MVKLTSLFYQNTNKKYSFTLKVNRKNKNTKQRMKTKNNIIINKIIKQRQFYIQFYIHQNI